VTRDWRDELIEELRAVVAQQQAEIEALKKRGAELEERLRTSSRNSSKPPSSDGPSKPRPKRHKGKRGRRSPGGQPGHEKHDRELCPTEEADKLSVVRPERCERCAKPLVEYDKHPVRHQHVELPPVRPLVHEVQLHAGWCKDCGAWTQAKLPPGIPTRAFGPSVDALVGVLVGVYRLSKRAVAGLMGELFGLRMSLGAVVDCQRAVSDSLEQPVVEARQFAQQQPVKNADETSWRQGRMRAWLWTLVTASVTVFQIHLDRSAQAARELLGKAFGILGTDRYSGYGWWPMRLRQLCWAHLTRDFTAISERGGTSERVGKALLREVDRMFAWWKRVKEGTMTRGTFQVYLRSVKRRVYRLLEQGTQAAEAKTARTCAKILTLFSALWTFARVEGVEPTNNSGERAVRHAVIIRKISYGTHSEWGSRFVERILTVHATCKQQGRSALKFIREACESALTRSPPPSLVPASAPSDAGSGEHALPRAA
jgi:transposase